jgi:hypothetical protein
MPIPRCQHVRVNGTQCGSPALRGKRFCYFHARHQLKPAKDSAFQFPTLEDANAIQVALMQVIRAIADNKIESKRAGLLLYALQTASCNLKRTSLEPKLEDAVLDTSVLGQEIQEPPDPVDAIRAMRRTYWKLRDPELINRDREIVARECARRVDTVSFPDVEPDLPTDDPLLEFLRQNSARSSGPGPATPDSRHPTGSVPGTRYSIIPPDLPASRSPDDL